MRCLSPGEGGEGGEGKGSWEVSEGELLVSAVNSNGPVHFSFVDVWRKGVLSFRDDCFK